MAQELIKVITLWEPDLGSDITPAGTPIFKQLDSFKRNESKNEVETATLQFEIGAPLPYDSVLTERTIFKVQYGDPATSYRLFRVIRIDYDMAGDRGCRVDCRALWADAADVLARTTRTGGKVDLSVTLVGLTMNEALTELIASAYGLPSMFALGTVEAEIQSEPVVVQYFGASFMQIIRDLTSQIALQSGYGCEYEFVWDDGNTRYDINLMRERGWVASEVTAGVGDPTLRPIHGPNPDDDSNRIKMNYIRDSRQYFNRIVPVSGTEDNLVTIADAVFLGDSDSPAGTLNFEPRVRIISHTDQHKDLYIGNDNIGFAKILTSTPDNAGNNAITTDGVEATMVGEWLRFALNAAGDELAYIDNADISVHGAVERLVSFNDVTRFPNLLVRNSVVASMDEYTGGLVDGWVEVGNPTTVAESSDEFFLFGDGAQKVTTVTDNEGIDAQFEVDGDNEYPISVWAHIRSDGTNFVRLELQDSEGEIWPKDEPAESNESALRGFSFGGAPLASGTATIRIIAPTSGTVFYVDAVAVTQSPEPEAYRDQMGSASLFEMGVKHLFEKGGVDPAAVSGQFLDVTAIHAGTEVGLGSHVEYKDLYDIATGIPVITVDTRVAQILTTESQINGEGRLLKQIRLSTERPDFTSRFRGIRHDRPTDRNTGSDNPTEAFRERIVRRDLFFATNAARVPFSDNVYPSWWGSLNDSISGAMTPGSFRWITGEGLQKKAGAVDFNVVSMPVSDWSGKDGHTLFFLARQDADADGMTLARWRRTGNTNYHRFSLRGASQDRFQFTAIDDTDAFSNIFTSYDPFNVWGIYVVSVEYATEVTGNLKVFLHAHQPTGTLLLHDGFDGGAHSTAMDSFELFEDEEGTVAATLLYTAVLTEEEKRHNIGVLIDYANELGLTTDPWEYGDLLSTPIVDRTLSGPIVDLQFDGGFLFDKGKQFVGPDTHIVANHGYGPAVGVVIGSVALEDSGVEFNFKLDPRGDGMKKTVDDVNKYILVDDPMDNGKAALSTGGYTWIQIFRIGDDLAHDVSALYRSSSIGCELTTQTGGDFEIEVFDDAGSSTNTRFQFTGGQYDDGDLLATFVTVDIDGSVTGTARQVYAGWVHPDGSVEVFEGVNGGASTFTIDSLRILRQGVGDAMRRVAFWPRPMNLVEIDAQVRNVIDWQRQFGLDLPYTSTDIITIGARNATEQMARLLSAQGFDFGDLVDLYPMVENDADPGYLYGSMTGQRFKPTDTFSFVKAGLQAPVNADERFRWVGIDAHWPVDPVDDYSVTIVFKSEGTGTAAETIFFLSSGNSTQPGVRFKYTESSGSVSVAKSDDAAVQRLSVSTPGSSLPAGKWTIVTASWDKSTSTLDLFYQSEDDTGSGTVTTSYSPGAETFDEVPTGTEWFDQAVQAGYGATTIALVAIHAKTIDQALFDRNVRALTNVLRVKGISLSTNDSEQTISQIVVDSDGILLEVKRSEGQQIGKTTGTHSGTITTINIDSLRIPMLAGDRVAIAYKDGIEYLDTFTLSADASIGATTLSVDSQATSGTIPADSLIFDELSTSLSQIILNKDGITLQTSKTSNIAIALIDGPWNPADPTTTVAVQSIDTPLVDNDKLRIAYFDSGTLHNKEFTVDGHHAVNGSPTTITVDSTTVTGTVPDATEVIYVDSVSRALIQLSPGNILIEAAASTAGEVVAAINLSATVVDGARIEINGATTFTNEFNPSRVRVYAQTSAPTGVTVGDLWYDTDDNNSLHKWDGANWNDVIDNDKLQDIGVVYYLNDVIGNAPANRPSGNAWQNGDRIRADLGSGKTDYIRIGVDWFLNITTVDGAIVNTGILNAGLVSVQDQAGGSPDAWIDGGGFHIETPATFATLADATKFQFVSGANEVGYAYGYRTGTANVAGFGQTDYLDTTTQFRATHIHAGDETQADIEASKSGSGFSGIEVRWDEILLSSFGDVVLSGSEVKVNVAGNQFALPTGQGDADEFLQTDGAGGTAWVAGGGGGEVNTGLSLGSGADVFKSKVGVQLQFRSIVVGTGLDIVENVNDINIVHDFGEFTGTLNSHSVDTGDAFWMRDAGDTIRPKQMQGQYAGTLILEDISVALTRSGLSPADRLMVLDVGANQAKYSVLSEMKVGWLIPNTGNDLEYDRENTSDGQVLIGDTWQGALQFKDSAGTTFYLPYFTSWPPT